MNVLGLTQRMKTAMPVASGTTRDEKNSRVGFAGLTEAGRRNKSWYRDGDIAKPADWAYDCWGFRGCPPERNKSAKGGP